MINNKMTALQKCIEWMRIGGKTSRSIQLHQKIAKQADIELTQLKADESQLKISENANKVLVEQNNQLCKQIKKDAELLSNALQLLDHK